MYLSILLILASDGAFTGVVSSGNSGALLTLADLLAPDLLLRRVELLLLLFLIRRLYGLEWDYLAGIVAAPGGLLAEALTLCRYS